MQRRQLQGALRLHRILGAVAALAVLGLVLTAATPLREQLTTGALIAVSGAVAAFVLLCMILLVAETGGRHGHPG
jgi:hypothetical protein